MDLHLKVIENQFDLPNHLEAEYLIVGGLLSNNAIIAGVGDLRPEHFSDEVNGMLFGEMVETIRNGGVANPVTLAGKFDRKHLAQLMAPIAYFNLAECVSLVIAAHAKRRLVASCQEAIALLSSDPTATAEEAAAMIGAEVDSISERDLLRRAKTDYQVTCEILEDAKRHREPISTGYDLIDQAMGGGLHAGKSYGFAARKKVGKTVLASSISYNLNKSGVHHLFICGEMGPKEIHQRNLARELQIFPSKFRAGFDKNTALHRDIMDIAERSKRCILYQNAPGLTFEDLRRYCGAAVYGKKIQGIILDYWQLVGGKPKGQSTSEHLDTVAQWIADFCRQHQLWSIVMAQINQEGNTRGGEGIRLAFDQVYQINREDLNQPDAWIEMMDTRYTAWGNIGSKENPALFLKQYGPYFEECT